MIIPGIIASSRLTVSGAYESIATQTLTGNSTSVTFSSIPSTYQHLQIRAITRTADVTTDSSAFLQVNGDTGANYASHNLRGTGTSALAGGSASGTAVQIASFYPGASYSANIYGVTIIDLHDYKSTTKNKTFRIFNGVDNNAGDTSSRIYLVSGLWMNTNAVTSITITGNNAFASGCVFSLYGIKGA